MRTLATEFGYKLLDKPLDYKGKGKFMLYSLY